MVPLERQALSCWEEFLPFPSHRPLHPFCHKRLITSASCRPNDITSLPPLPRKGSLLKMCSNNCRPNDITSPPPLPCKGSLLKMCSNNCVYLTDLSIKKIVVWTRFVITQPAQDVRWRHKTISLRDRHAGFSASFEQPLASLH